LWGILNLDFPSHMQLPSNILTMDIRILTRIRMPIIPITNLILTLNKLTRTLTHTPITNT
jgi:hypothetical protein